MFTQRRETTGIIILTETVRKKTKGPGDVVNLTADVDRLIKESDLMEGQATIFVTGSTAGVTTLEFEPEIGREKNRFQGPSLTIPFVDQDLVLGEEQQIVLTEFDDHPRERTVVIQLIGN